MKWNWFLNFNSTYVTIFSIWIGKITKLFKKFRTIFCLPRLCFYPGTIFSLSLPDINVQSVIIFWHFFRLFWLQSHISRKSTYYPHLFSGLGRVWTHFHTRPKIKFKKNQKNLKKHKKQSLKKQDEKAFLSIIYC